MSRDFNSKLQSRKKYIKKSMAIADRFGKVAGYNQFEGEENRLNKHNLSCGCQLCKPNKHLGNSGGKFSPKDKRIIIKGLEINDDEIYDDYFDEQEN